jgi:hypothetical protein
MPKSRRRKKVGAIPPGVVQMTPEVHDNWRKVCRRRLRPRSAIDCTLLRDFEPATCSCWPWPCSSPFVAGVRVPLIQRIGGACLRTVLRIDQTPHKVADHMAHLFAGLTGGLSLLLSAAAPWAVLLSQALGYLQQQSRRRARAM